MPGAIYITSYVDSRYSGSYGRQHSQLSELTQFVLFLLFAIATTILLRQYWHLYSPYLYIGAIPLSCQSGMSFLAHIFATWAS